MKESTTVLTKHELPDTDHANESSAWVAAAVACLNRSSPLDAHWAAVWTQRATACATIALALQAASL